MFPNHFEEILILLLSSFSDEDEISVWQRVVWP